ncbi:MAG: DUF433 domain-containing protein [Verrucomicrobiota bacterium]
MEATTVMPHIRLDDAGRAWIDDTNVKVIEVVLDHLAYGWSPEEMHCQHPRLSLAQIYAALAYYYDHRPEFDRLIAESTRRADSASAASAESPVRRRLRAAGKL